MSEPLTLTSPDVGLTNPQIILIIVVLPAPLGPNNAKISPLLISRFTLLRASKLLL